jgi:hypothetical protein
MLGPVGVASSWRSKLGLRFVKEIKKQHQTQSGECCPSPKFHLHENR